jgi:hypothetical protein
MSTRRQIAAYREICNARHEDHMRKTYGMLPIPARFMGKCGCGRIFEERDGWTAGTPCRFGRGDKIARFRGGWWNLQCIDRVKAEEFQQSARFVLEDVITLKDGTIKAFAKAWTNDPKEADIWSRNAADLAEIDPTNVERVIDRSEL